MTPGLAGSDAGGMGGAGGGSITGTKRGLAGVAIAVTVSSGAAAITDPSVLRYRNSRLA